MAMACASASVIGGAPCAIPAGVSAGATSKLSASVIMHLYMSLLLLRSNMLRSHRGVECCPAREDDPNYPSPRSQVCDAQVIPSVCPTTALPLKFTHANATRALFRSAAP